MGLKEMKRALAVELSAESNMNFFQETKTRHPALADPPCLPPRSGILRACTDRCSCSTGEGRGIAVTMVLPPFHFTAGGGFADPVVPAGAADRFNSTARRSRGLD